MKKILQLLEANRDRGSFRVKAEDGSDEAIAEGFCDRKAGETAAPADPEQEEAPEETVEPDPEAPPASNLFDLSAYRNAPRALKQRARTHFDALAADRQRAEARLALIERAA